MGKYDSLIDEEVGAKPAPTTPQEANYGALIDEELSSAPLHNSLFGTAGTNPDEEAKKRKLAKELNTPAAILPNDAEQQVQLKKLDADVIKTTAPASAKFLTNEDNARVTGLNGVDKLVQMEQAYKTYNPANIKKYIENYTSTGKPAAEAVQRLSELKKQGVDLTKELDPYARSTEDYFKDPIKAAAGGANIMAAGFVELGRIAPNPMSALMSALSPEYAKERRSAYDTVQQQLNDNVEYWQGRKSPAMQKLVEDFGKAGVADSVMMLVANPSLAVDQLSQSTPYMLPGAGAARGGAGAMATFNAFIEAADAANTARQEAIKNGQSLEQQDRSAMIAAVTTAPLAFLGNKLTGTAAFEADFFTKGSTGQKLLDAVVKEAISGAIEEGSNQLGVNIGAAQYDDNRQILEGVGKAMVIGGLLESTHAVGMTTAERALRTFVKDTENVTNLVAESNTNAAQAVAAHDTIEQLSAMTADNDLRTRAPEAFQEFIETMTEGEDLQEVYVDGATALEAIKDNYTDLIRTQPELFARIQEAAGLGHDVQFTVGEYLTYFAGNPIEKTVLPMLKSEPGGATYQEAQEFYNKQAELFQSEVQAVAEQNEPVLSREEFETLKSEEATRAPIEQTQETKDGSSTVQEALPASYEEYVAQHKNKREVFARDVETVETTLFNEFQKAGRFTSSVNRAYVAPLVEFYKTQAKNFGIMPSEMYAKYPLKIQSFLGLLPSDAELNQTEPATIDDFRKGNLQGLLAKNDWAILTPENPNAVEVGEEINAPRRAAFEAKLNEQGIKYQQVRGKYGSEENSYILLGVNAQQALALGREFNQESVLTKDGFVYQDGSRNPIMNHITEHDAAPDNYYTTVTFPDGSTSLFTADIDFDNRFKPGEPIPPGFYDSLAGAPASAPTPNFKVRGLAKQYAEQSGITSSPRVNYVKADPERGKRIADAYEAMEHKPDDPEVKAAYRALIDETLAQYQLIKEMDLEIEFIEPGQADPYPEGPRQAIDDIRNGHLWVFPTDAGFGSSDQQYEGNPLLEVTKEKIGDRVLLANDVFRIVHDVFGHAKDGVGFGANGEENAWQSHVRMYSPLAARAMTTETRGQNSWVNFGPFGETNRADPRNTTYADQKTGLLPEWVSTEGIDNPNRVTPEMVGSLDQTQTDAFKKWFGDSKVVDENGEPLVVYHGTSSVFESFDTTGGRSPGAFFSNKINVAESFTENGYVMPVYLKMVNPKIVDWYGGYWDYGLDDDGNEIGGVDGVVADAREQGYDGVIIKNIVDFGAGAEGEPIGTNYVVFEPTQIKSTVGNIGTFDPANPSIVNQGAAKVGQVAIRGVHFSKEQRSTLNGGYYGTGIKGAEGERLRQAKDGRIKQRLYFYVDEGKGVFPEYGVGNAKHVVDLPNMYDGARNPLKLPTRNADGERDMNVFESAVIDAGFDGYYIESAFGRQGAAVLLGDASRSVKPLTEAVMNQSIYYSQLTRSVAALKQNKGTVEQWKGIIKNLPGVKADEIEAVGINEWLDLQTGSVTKEDIIGYLDANGVQVEEVVLGELTNNFQIVENDDGEFDVVDMLRVDDDGNPWVLFTGTSRSEAFDYLDTIPVPADQSTKFDQWVVGGENTGEDYREVLITLPKTERQKEYIYQVYGYAPQDGFKTEEEAKAYIERQHKLLDELADLAKTEPSLQLAVDRMRQEYKDFPFGINKYESPASIRADKTYRSSHFKEPNILAHTRVDFRRGPNGERVMFVNEIQSDWAQQGRDEGFTENYKREEIEPIAEDSFEANDPARYWYFRVPDNVLQIPKAKYPSQEEAIAYVLTKQKREGTVPKGPFVQKTDAWVSLVIKRLLRYAADQGADKIAIINGAQAAEIYKLSKQVESVSVFVSRDGGYGMEITDTDGEFVTLPKDKNLTEQEVIDTIGKDVGKRAIQQANEVHAAETAYRQALRTEGVPEEELDALRAKIEELDKPITGVDLDIGGEGMKVFYDQIVPKVAKDVLKKLGAGPLVPGYYAVDKGEMRAALEKESARVEAARLAIKDSLQGLDAANYNNYQDMNDVGGLFRKIQAARKGTYTNKTIGNIPEAERAAYWDAAEEQVRTRVTPAVAEYEEAMIAYRFALNNPVYSSEANLAVTMTPDLKAKIQSGLPLFQGTRGSFNLDTLTMTLMQGADLSTVIHESGHFYLEMLEKLANTADAPQQVQDDYAKTMEWFGLTSAQWAQMSLEQKRPYHEQWAESFERWNLEGQAPTQGLQPIFSRFRAWLLSVYKSVEEFVRLNPGAGKLNDEVRGVFSRLLASAEAIEATEQARAYQPLFGSAEQAGVSQNAYEDYVNLGKQATQDAIDALQARSMRDMKWLTNARNKALKDLQATAKAARAKVQVEVTEQVTSEPIYQAMRFLRTGETKAPNGDTIKALQGYKLDKAIIAEMFPQSALDRPDLSKLRGMTSAEGLDPDIVAKMFGLPSGDALVREIVTAENMRDKIQGLTDQRMLEEHGDLVDEKSLQRAADEAVHNEARAKFMATGLKMLSSSPISVTQMVKAAKQAAENVIANKRVRDVKPKQYTAAESRASKEVLKLAAKDPAQAAEKQRAALLNNRLAAAAQDAVTEVEKALRYLGKFNNEGTRKNLDLDYLEQIDALLEPFDLRKGLSLSTIDARTTLAEWVQNQEAMGFEPTIDPVAMAEARQKSYKNMTMTELRGLVDTIKQIEHMGRMKKKLLTAIDKAEFAERIAEAKLSIALNANRVVEEKGTPSDVVGQLGQWVRQMFASHRKFTSFMRELDGGQNNGVLFNLLVRPMALAGNTETEMKAQAAERLAQLFKPIQNKMSSMGNLYARRRQVPGTNISMTHEQRVMFAMNWGNEGNRQRLLDGGITGKKAMSEAEARAVLDTLTKEEWDFVQGVWDYIAEYRPMIQEQERQLTGKTPEWVEPAEVETRFGTYRGGYFPAKYDTVLSTRSDALEAVADLRTAMKGAFGSAAARNGYTKARAAQVVGRPLLLNFNAISRHVNEVVHRLSWQAWLIDAARVSRALDNDFRTHLGAEATKEINDAIRDIAQGDAPATGPFEVFLNRIRTGTSIVGMGWKITTALLQPTGLSQSMARVGGRHMTKALARYIASPLDSSDWVNENSSLMRNRGRTMNREMNEILNTVREGKKVSAVMGSFFYLVGKLQRTVDVPTFIGAYEKSLEDQQYESAASEAERKRIEATAIAVAEQTVIDTQGGGELKDLAKVQRGSPIFKLFTNFYSYMSTVYNLNVENYRTKNLLNPSELGLFAAETLLINFVPVVMAVALKNTLKGQCDWDDMECLAQRYASEQISHVFGQMVGLREIGVSVDALTGGEAFGYTGPAGLRFFVDVYKSAEQINQGEMDMALFKSVNNTLGALFHYPAGQINATVDGAIAIENGEVEGAAILPALIAGAPK